MEQTELETIDTEAAERQELLVGSEGNDGAGKIQTMKGKLSVEEKENEEKENEEKEDEEKDPIAECIGNYGKWQLKMTFLLSLCSFPCTFHIFSPNFIAAMTEHCCSVPAHLKEIDRILWTNLTNSADRCQIRNVDWSLYTPDTWMNFPHDAEFIPCTSWEWDKTILGKTIISEWKLLCDRDYLNTVADMLFLCGVAIGGVVSGMISDRFGRKRTLVAVLITQTILAFIIIVCPWFELYLILRTLLGFVSVSVVFSAFVLIVELVGGKWRTIAGVCNFFPLPVSYILVALASMAIPDWRYLQLALSLPGLLLISLWWIVPESPHWLLSMGRISEVKKILEEVAAYNKRPLPANIDKILQPNTMPKEPQKPAVVFDLVRKPFLKISLCVFVMWFATTYVYYGLVLNMSSFGTNLHMTAILSGIVEIPAIALSIPVLLKMGRRYPICLTLIIASIGIGCVATVDAFSDKQWLKSTFVMISKFAIGATNGVLPTFTAELYPTRMRNMGVGASQVSAGIGLVSLPYLWTLDSPTKIPMIVMGGIGLLGGLVVLLLPETANRSLTATGFGEKKENSANSNGPTTLNQPKSS